MGEIGGGGGGAREEEAGPRGRSAEEAEQADGDFFGGERERVRRKRERASGGIARP